MKTRKEILTQYYVSQTDIQRLLQISYRDARDIYRSLVDLQSPLHAKKVPLKAVLKRMKVNYDFLHMQIEEEEKTAPHC